MPQDLYGAAGASNGTYAYAAGGYSDTTLDTFYRYNPVNERWDTYPPPMPAAVAMASAVYYPTTNSIYVFGGKDVDTGEVSAATRVFDITANTWTSVASMPEPRASMAAGYNSANGRIYLVGGYSGDDPSSAETTAWEFNPANNMFSTRAPIPQAVGGAAAGVVNGEFLVAGGRNAAGAIVDLVWVYSSTTNSWTGRPHLPSPTDAAGSAVASGKLWVFGGETPSRPERGDCCIRSGHQYLDERPEPERRSLAPGGRGDREHARGRGRGTRARRRRQRRRCWMRKPLPASQPDTVFSENFDGVTPPALPPGWTATNVGAAAAVGDLELGHANAAFRHASERGLRR